MLLRLPMCGPQVCCHLWLYQYHDCWNFVHQLRRYALWTCRKHSSLQPLGGSSSAPRSSTKGPCSYVLELGGQPCHLCRVLEQVQELLRALASLSLGVGRTKCGILLLLVVFIVSGMQVPRSVQTVSPACAASQANSGCVSWLVRRGSRAC